MTPTPSARRNAFTLAEILITIGIIATVVISLLALLPAGMEASNNAAHKTVTAVILEDLHDRLEAEQTTLIEGEVGDGTKFFYDSQGVYIPPEADEEAKERRLYWAKVNLVDIKPENLPTTQRDSSDLMAIRVELYWPVNPDSGEPLREEPGTEITYYATSLAGVDWKTIDQEFEPRIEF